MNKYLNSLETISDILQSNGSDATKLKLKLKMQLMN